MEGLFEHVDCVLPIIHIISGGCECEECVKTKDRYVRIFDMDRFVDNLNDWD